MENAEGRRITALWHEPKSREVLDLERENKDLRNERDDLRERLFAARLMVGGLVVVVIALVVALCWKFG